MSARSVIDRVTAAARNATLEADQLRAQFRQVEQFDAAGVHRRDQLTVDVGRVERRRRLDR
jgi:hypothetical protein